MEKNKTGRRDRTPQGVRGGVSVITSRMISEEWKARGESHLAIWEKESQHKSPEVCSWNVLETAQRPT